jgi:hypothetical protein
MTGTGREAPKLDPRLDQAISRLMDAATWVARVLLPFAIGSLIGAVAVIVALPAQWLNEALVEAFGPAGLGALWLAVLLNTIVIVGAPIAMVVGLVLWLV